MDKTINKVIASSITVVVALVVPAYYFRDINWSQVTITPVTFLLPGLYLIVVIGFVFVIFGKSGIELTSKNKDIEIKKKLKDFDKKLRPIYWLFFIAFAIWFVYGLWQLYPKA